ncbi:MAG: SurA N-terminal domain-containing protein [Arcobacteraceae bacterium]|nr:SurA N-terminal domain-containing protein [Arcobacteraceae bacterium]
MIDWMQRHKKWLVVTIWISVIAFVGAGFVGWGAYDFGKSDGAVAQVGKKEIPMNELQREYSNLYSQYSSIFGDSFNQELAKQLGLEQLALQTLIQKYLLLSYADDLGISITDEEVATELIKIDEFKKEGKFDKDQYVTVLRQNKIVPVEFEKSLKNDLLVQKIQNMFKVQSSQKEIENISSLIFIKNDLQIKIIDNNSVTLNIQEEELKNFWEENKNNYLSELVYEISLYETATKTIEFTDSELTDFYEKTRLDYKHEDGKIKTFDEALDDLKQALTLEESKNDALRTYLALKKGEVQFQKITTLGQNSTEILPYKEQLSNLKPDDIVKPFIVDDSYVILKLNKIIQPEPLSFENAKELAKKDFIEKNSSLALENKAKEVLSNNSLESIGYVSRESVENISGLRSDEASEFLNQLFKTKDTSGVIMLQGKAVAYKILNSKLGIHNESKNLIVSNTIRDIKTNELFSKLLESLEQKYKVISYMK